MTPSISEYFNNSNLDISTYVKSKRIGLAHEITDRTKIYLDTKYWVLLRDVRLGRSNCPDTIKLLNILESRVANRTLICPLNAEHL